MVAKNPDFYHIYKNPWGDDEVVCVRALVPDYAILHVQEADIYGNARILGPSYQDALMARAAKKVILTAERIVGTYRMQEEPKLTAIPHFLVEAVVELPGGAKPGICYPEYLTVDWADHKAYQKAVKADEVKQFADKMLEGRA
ncbi:3-oxoadipate coa-transferase subunit a [hydrocarbon metagenome]|uniref:3-oxoadipate coa-transferase subunit a n=1 Tax=hydrocarbon metagenome TaxID=938273 RepID=A0A0W8E7C0_9ZZZZ